MSKLIWIGSSEHQTKLKEMNLSKGQGELFNQEDFISYSISSTNQLTLKKDDIEAWQSRIYSHQKLLLNNEKNNNHQKSIFNSSIDQDTFKTLNILTLTPLPLNFWRWPKTPHEGPAIYLVMDKPQKLHSHILLYIGETISAETRWKGDHDCKDYLQSYSEACQKANLTPQLSIRFWQDVPKDTRKRRELEQQLIQAWLPAFNKETREIWDTPFTNEIK